MLLAFVIGAWSIGGASAGAQAAQLAPPAPVRGPTPVTVEVLAGTSAPIDLAITARLVIFDRLLIGGSIGTTVYGGPIGSVVAGYSGQNVGPLIQSLVDGALVLRAMAGVRPFGGDGLELSFGYVYLQHATSISGSELASAFGTQVPVDAIGASLAVHALAGEVAWNIVLLDHLILRPAIGWTQAFAASATLSDPGASANVAAGLDAAGSAVGAAIAAHAMTPTIALSAGYRF